MIEGESILGFFERATRPVRESGPSKLASALGAMTRARARVAGADQGFLLSDGRFVLRNAAERVARASGQLKGPLHGSILTTEDLW